MTRGEQRTAWLLVSVLAVSTIVNVMLLVRSSPASAPAAEQGTERTGASPARVPDVAAPCVESGHGISMTFTSLDEEYPDNDVVVLCFDRAIDTSRHPDPDRAVERQPLLARAAVGLAKCNQLADAPSTVEVRLLLDESGAVKGSTRAGELSGTDAARCVEKVLKDEAKFAPGKGMDQVPISVQLEPGS